MPLFRILCSYVFLSPRFCFVVRQLVFVAIFVLVIKINCMKKSVNGLKLASLVAQTLDISKEMYS